VKIVMLFLQLCFHPLYNSYTRVIYTVFGKGGGLCTAVSSCFSGGAYKSSTQYCVETTSEKNKKKKKTATTT